MTPELVVFGEVLFDRFPDGAEVLGGAPFNVAWNLQGLGADPLLLSRVGEDELGERIRAAMEERGLRTEGLQDDPELPTGTVEVRLRDGEPSFDILPDRAYDRIGVEELPTLRQPLLLYHGSLAVRRSISRSTLYTLIERFAPTRFVDVNLRPPWWDREQVWSLLSGSAEVKLNEAELDELAGEGDGREDRARRLMDRFGIERIWLTRGKRGAVLVPAGEEARAVKPRRELQVVDAVGAGDAFAAVLLLGRLRSWSVETTLERAQELAAAVVEMRGATTRQPAFYDRFRDDWKMK